MKNILSLIALVLCCFSCEEKPVIIPEFEPLTTGKVVLVEELTGVDCSNCPAASARLESILDLYPENVVVVGVHGILLSAPIEGSKYDFRTPDAVELETFLAPFAKPTAVVNRVRFPENFNDWGLILFQQWQGFIEKELEKEQVIKLSINKSYDVDTRQLTIDVAALPLVDLSGDFKITVLFTESNIVDAQKDPTTIIPDYVHKHILREIITETTGDFFATELEKNVIKTKTYTFTLPETPEGLWQEENIEIIAFIANTEGTSEEVLQAAKTYVVE